MWPSAVRLVGKINKDWCSSITDMLEDSGKSPLRWSLANGLLPHRQLYLRVLVTPFVEAKTWITMATLVRKLCLLSYHIHHHYFWNLVWYHVFVVCRSHCWCIWSGHSLSLPVSQRHFWYFTSHKSVSTKIKQHCWFVRNVSWAPNQDIRMSMSNDAKNVALHHRNKLYFKIYWNRKQLF